MTPSKSRKLFALVCMLNKSPVGVEVTDEKRLLRADQEYLDVDDVRIRGFQQFDIKELPRLKHIKKLGRKPLDFESFGGFFLLSPAAKKIFEVLSPLSFQFQRCYLDFDDGSDGKEMWLADVTLILDALDEDRSQIEIRENARKNYLLSGANNLLFHRDRIGEVHVFRMKHAEARVVCDEHAKLVWKNSRLKGAMFINIGSVSDTQ